MKEAPPWFDEFIDGNNRGIKLDIAVGAQIDMSASSDAVIIAGQMPHSVPSQAFDGNANPIVHTLYSNGGWDTRRTVITPDGPSSSQVGVISDVISDDNKEIDWECNIMFTRLHQSGLTLYFNDGMIAEDFDITVGDAIIQTEGGGGISPIEPGELTWSIDDGVLNIGSTGAIFRIPIPDYAEGEAPWYSRRNEITTLNVGTVINGIGTNAFYGLTNLTTIQSLGLSIYISTGAFKGCTGLTSFTVPATIGEVFGKAFEGCVNISAFTVQGTPQIYDGGLGTGTKDDLMEIAVSGIVPTDEMGNRYTKIWAGSIGTTADRDLFDGCYRIFGTGAFALPTTPPSESFEEVLIFDRVVTVSGAGVEWNNIYVGGLFIGNAVTTFLANFSPLGLTSLRNADITTRTLLINSQFLTQSTTLAPGTTLACRMSNNSDLGRANIEGLIITDSAISNSNGQYYANAIDEMTELKELSGTGCEGNVLYGTGGYSVIAFCCAMKPQSGIIKIRNGTRALIKPIVYCDTVDLPATLNDSYATGASGATVGASFDRHVLLGDVDTIIHRGSLKAYPNGGINNAVIPTESPIKTRRLYIFTAHASGYSYRAHYNDPKLEILDIVGGSASSNQIAAGNFYNLENIQEIRIRNSVNSTYAQFGQLKIEAPAKTINVYTNSGTPTGGTYSILTRVGTPPTREVS